MFGKHAALVAALLVAGCTPTGAPVETGPVVVADAGPQIGANAAIRNFQAAVARVEPVAEAECRARTQGVNCDFLIQVDPNPKAPPNAFQSLNQAGRPLLVFTQALIFDARNVDEIAFVIGHESAHHIAQHIAQQQRSAQTGAYVGGLLASMIGVDGVGADALVQASAAVGARRFSKEHELEADALGTIITHRAGYNPVRGSAFFARIPDPGDRFLGSHPPNSERAQTVRRVAAGL